MDELRPLKVLLIWWLHEMNNGMRVVTLQVMLKVVYLREQRYESGDITGHDDYTRWTTVWEWWHYRSWWKFYNLISTGCVHFSANLLSVFFWNTKWQTLKYWLPIFKFSTINHVRTKKNCPGFRALLLETPENRKTVWLWVLVFNLNSWGLISVQVWEPKYSKRLHIVRRMCSRPVVEYTVESRMISLKHVSTQITSSDGVSFIIRTY